MISDSQKLVMVDDREYRPTIIVVYQNVPTIQAMEDMVVKDLVKLVGWLWLQQDPWHLHPKHQQTSSEMFRSPQFWFWLHVSLTGFTHHPLKK